jgi:hypothetical protein
MMPPDPRRTTRGPQQHPGMPGTPKKTNETNWTAVGALAAVAAAAVAFLAYAVPPGSAPPDPLPGPGSSQEAPLYTTPPQEQSSTPAATSPGFASSGPAVSQPSGPPPGCQQAIAAINTYNQDVGSTSVSEANAADRAVNEIEAAQEAANYSGTVGADLDDLNIDFERLSDDVMEGNGSDYDTTAAQTNVDARQLETDCNG